MKKQIKKWTIRLAVTILLVSGFLIGIVLNPTLLYAHKTIHENYTVYYNSTLDSNFKIQLYKTTALLKTSELYNPNVKFDICLNDGSGYPAFIQKLFPPAFGVGFYNKIVLMGKTSFTGNYNELHGYKWNLTQLLVHEAIHCLQFKKLGFWKTQPLAKFPKWKKEGYAEYVARRSPEQSVLSTNIESMAEMEKKGNNDWAITFRDGTIAPIEYFRYWILIQYCIDIKKMTYLQVLQDTTREEIIREQMMHWYKAGK